MKQLSVSCLFIIFSVFLFATQESKMVTEYDRVVEIYNSRAKDAQKEIRNYLATFPYTTYEDNCFLMQGVLKIEHGSFTQGIKDLEKVNFASLNDNFQNDYLFYHGYAYIMVDNYSKACADFQQLVKRESSYKNKAQFYLAYCYYRDGKYDKCLVPFTKIEKDPNYKSTVPYYIIQILLHQDSTTEVIARCTQLLKSQPENKNNVEVYRILGEVYFKQGVTDKALDNLRKYYKMCQAQKIKAERYDLYLLGKMLYDKKNYEASVEFFKQVSDQNDSIAEYGRFMLGNAYVKLKQIEKAKMSFFATTELNFTPSIQEEALYNYVLCSFNGPTPMGESVNAFKLFVNKYPNSRFENEIIALLGDALLHSNNYEVALSVIDSIPIKGIRLQDTKQYLRYQIGTQAFINGKLSDAEKWFTEIIINAGGNRKQNVVSDAYYWRAETRYKLKKYSACYSDLEQYFKQNKDGKAKNYPNARYLCAYTLYMNKEYNKAKPAFEKYIVLINKENVTFVDAYNRMGDCDFNNRKFSSAINNYKIAIDLQTAGSDYAIYQCGYAHGLMNRYSDKVHYMTLLQQTYPRSDYADDALYEKARALIEQQKEDDAIQTYQQLIKTYPKSPFIRKASVETAMLFRNAKDYENAINWYKRTIERFPRTEEAYNALNDLEAIYVENNNIGEYLTYVKGLQKLNMNVSNKDDSLIYVTAELQYMAGKYKTAITAFENYLISFCPSGRYCVIARYYLADSYYKIKDSTNALTSYIELTKIDGNQYMEEACMRVAELAYDKKDYKTALTYFQKMKAEVSDSRMLDIANLGILRCSFLLNLHEKTIEIASMILKDPNSTENIKEEALYNRAKAYVATNKYKHAISDLKTLKINVKTATGAEIKYLLAECYFNIQKLDEAEKTIMDFTQQNTSHKYWLAKSLILLADIYTQKDDIFQAQQYLLSIQNNYHENDDIGDIIAEKLEQLTAMQNKKDNDLKNEQ